jgi:predicted small secreted protein
MKRLTCILASLVLLALAISLPACNTTKGVGTDIENAGGGLKHSAERNGAE